MSTGSNIHTPEPADDGDDLMALFLDAEREAQALSGATPECAVHDLERTLLDLLALTGGDLDITEPFLQ